MTIVEAVRSVTGGIDTHLDFHVAAALDPLGGLLGSESFATTPAGYSSLLAWLESFGDVCKVAWRAPVPTVLAWPDTCVKPTSPSSRSIAPTRPNDAEVASPIRSTPSRLLEPHWAEGATSISKSKDGAVEAIRVLVVAKRSARHARVKALTQMRHLVITAPDQLRCRLSGLSVAALVSEAARLRPSRSGDPVMAAHKASLCSLAHRVESLEDEIAELDKRIETLLAVTAPDLLALFGVGPDTAAALLVAAGDNPERLHSEAAWAHLCGAAPIRASSGKVTRYRLDRGGDRQANSALWRIAMVRIAHDPTTTAYFERKVKEGRSKKDVIRLLKRYIAREVYHYLPRG
jgi:transposase